MMTLALSYEAIAERLGIALPSARRLVHRKKWQKGKGNDGRAVVQVPAEFLNGRPSDTQHDGPADGPNDSPADSPALSEVLGRLVTAQAELVAMAGRLGAAEGEIHVLRQERAAQIEALNAVLASEKQRAEEWKAVADRFALQAEALTNRRWWSWRRAG